MSILNFAPLNFELFRSSPLMLQSDGCAVADCRHTQAIGQRSPTT